MWKQYKDVEEFQRKFGYRVGDLPGHPPKSVREFRIRLIAEECRELLEVIAKPDSKLQDVLGECIDLIYVVLGTLVSYGLNPMNAWKLIQRANMAKEPVDGDKPRKPKGWKKANLNEDIAKQMLSKWRVRWRPVWGFIAYTPENEVSLYSWGVHIGPLEIIRRK